MSACNDKLSLPAPPGGTKTLPLNWKVTQEGNPERIWTETCPTKPPMLLATMVIVALEPGVISTGFGEMLNE